MSSVGLAKWSLRISVWLMVVAVPGFIVILVLNAFVLDDYDAYGEIAIPGSGSVHLPRGEVTISLHTMVAGNSNGGLPVPPLGVTFTPPDGVAQPVLTENIGSTTSVNNDVHVRVWTAQIPANGTYNVITDGQVGGYIAPRLAFGHGSPVGFMVWVFVGMFVVGLIGSIISSRWSRRARRKAAANVVAGFPEVPPVAPLSPPLMTPRVTPAMTPHVVSAPSTAYEPSDEGVRLERLKTLASLRDSGALTEAEFEQEKRRILDGF